jgi:hypothetical protein
MICKRQQARWMICRRWQARGWLGIMKGYVCQKSSFHCFFLHLVVFVLCMLSVLDVMSFNGAASLSYVGWRSSFQATLVIALGYGECWSQSWEMVGGWDFLWCGWWKFWAFYKLEVFGGTRHTDECKKLNSISF